MDILCLSIEINRIVCLEELLNKMDEKERTSEKKATIFIEIKYLIVSSESAFSFFLTIAYRGSSNLLFFLNFASLDYDLLTVLSSVFVDWFLT